LSTKLLALSALLLPAAVGAQTFVYSGTGDLLAGFRKTGNFQGSNEVVANIGNITDLLLMTPGAQSNLTVPSASQLAAAYTNGNVNLQWSFFSTFSGTSPWVTSLGTFPQSTIWYTLPRTSLGVQTPAPSRIAGGAQGPVRNLMIGVGQNAVTISAPLATGTLNGPNLVSEPTTGNGSTDLTAFIGDLGNPAIGDWQGQYFSSVVENTNGGPFTAPTQSDLYQSVPSSVIGGRGAVTNVDPISGQTNGSAYYIGYFTFNTNGTIVFTRATGTVTPPPPTLTITTIGGLNTISFGTTNGATYSLIYTNLAGVTTARSNWFTLGSPIIGTGGTTNFTDSANTSGRVYSVTAH
jgi:hypothetical protein